MKNTNTKPNYEEYAFGHDDDENIKKSKYSFVWGEVPASKEKEKPVNHSCWVCVYV